MVSFALVKQQPKQTAFVPLWLGCILYCEVRFAESALLLPAVHVTYLLSVSRASSHNSDKPPPDHCREDMRTHALRYPRRNTVTILIVYESRSTPGTCTMYMYDIGRATHDVLFCALLSRQPCTRFEGMAPTCFLEHEGLIFFWRL